MYIVYHKYVRERYSIDRDIDIDRDSIQSSSKELDPSTAPVAKINFKTGVRSKAFIFVVHSIILMISVNLSIKYQTQL